MNSNQGVESVVRQAQSIEKIAKFAHRAVKALTEGDLLAFRSANDTLRFLRAELGEIESMPFGEEVAFQVAPSIVENTRLAAQIIKVAEEVIDAWNEKIKLGWSTGVLIDSREDCDLFIDVMLPKAWNFSKDMLFLVGGVTPQLIDAVKSRGQVCLAFINENIEDVSSKLDLLEIRVDEKVIDWRARLGQVPSPRLTTIRIGDAIDEASVDIVLESYKKWQKLEAMNYLTLRNFSERYVVQASRNISTLARSTPLSALEGIFSGRPAIIVSPGPSLDKNIHLLRDVDKRALIVAPAQTLTRLVRESIFPDIVMVTDPQDLTVEPYRFLEMSNSCPGAILIAKGNCHPNVLNTRFSELYWTLNGTPDDQWLADLFGIQPINISGGSVSVSAFRLVSRWGCQPIALVGQDLAMAGDKQYAGDRPNDRSSYRQLFELPGYFGGKVMSPSAYFMFHDQFVTFGKIAALRGLEGKLYNCTEGGAYIDGFQHIQLADFIEHNLRSYPSFDIHTIISQSQSRQLKVRHHLKDVVNRVESMLSDLQYTISNHDRIDRWLSRGDLSDQLMRRIDRDQSKFMEWVSSRPVLSVTHSHILKSAQYVKLNEKVVLNRIKSVHRIFQQVAETSRKIKPIVIEQLQMVREQII